MATAYDKNTGKTYTVNSNTPVAFDATTGKTGAVASTETTGEKKKDPTLQEQFKKREAESQAGINTIYDNDLNAQKQGLLNAYNANVQGQAQQTQDTQKAFQQAAYDIGVQNDRNDRNLTQFADVRDVNTGLGSQHQLNLGNARAGANAKVGFAQQQALAESQRQAALIETNYKNQVAAALADNDYKRAAALMDDYNNQNKWREAQAQQLASFGDFQAYRDLYGADTANTMQTMWNAQHPEEAYRLGRIDAETYKNITGQYPAGYDAGGGGWDGGGGWYDPSSPKPKPNADKPLNQMQLLSNFTNNRGTSSPGGVKSLAASGQTMKSTGYGRYHT